MKKQLLKLTSVFALLFYSLFFGQAGTSNLQVNIIASSPQPVVGSTVTFSIFASNLGPENNTGVSVQSLLPAGLQYVSKIVPTGTTYAESTGIWTIGNLSATSPKSILLSVTAKVLATGSRTYAASISSTSGINDPIASNNSASTSCGVERNSAPIDVPATEGAKSFPLGRPLPYKGFVIDLTKLDNSFKLSLGGKEIFANEIEFQGGTAGGITIEFVDGTQYEVETGTAGNRAVWQMVGTASAPLLRVVVSDDGNVTMFGSKTSGGSLFPLKLKSGSFKTLDLINNNTTVLITQRGTGPTGMTGRIYGMVPCVCYEDPNMNSGTPEPTLHGITTLKRAGVGNGDWPMNRNSAFTALESNTRGLVITRMATTELGQIAVPQDGMMVYDTTAKCLKIYTTDETTSAHSGWKCFTAPTCP